MTGSISVGANEVTLRDPAVFGHGRQRHAREFARRALAVVEVRAITMAPEAGEARVRYRAEPGNRKDVLVRLANAIGGESNPLDEAALPVWPDGETVTLSRLGDAITLLRLIDAKPGELRAAHPTLTAKDSAAARRMERSLRYLPGVLEAQINSGHGTLKVRFDPAGMAAADLVRAIEGRLASPDPLPKVPDPAPVPFGMANTTVGLGTVGELMLPVATPLAAGILVATKLGVVRDAAVGLSRGKVGVALFDTALLTCSIATGQVLAYALTDWSLRYWQRRGRRKLAGETQQLLDETLSLPECARLIAVDAGERVVPLALLRAGDRIRVDAGEPIPVDGRVVAGTALIDETLLGGDRAPMRKAVDDRVLAGTRLLVGGIEVVVERIGSDTTAGRIAGTIIEVASVVPRDRRLQRQAEHLAERTVMPTLATAGVGWLAGDLITVGAILHQDWISGPVLAVPLLTLSHVRAALASGALVRNGTAIPRMAESDFLVLDGDDPHLTAPGLELAAVHSRLPEADTVLRHVAGAGLFLGDERSQALVNACRDRGLIVRQPSLLALDGGRVEVRLGEHTIRLSDDPVPGSGGPPDLMVKIDDHEVARLSFRRGTRPQAADAVTRLRAAGMQTFVVSAGADSEANDLARRLGADFSGGELDAAGRIRFLQGLRRRGVKPAYVGRLAGRPDLAQASHVAVAVDGLNGEAAVGDVVLLGACYDGLADLVERSRTYEPGIVGASRKATLPNLLCVAGAFGGLLNGITAGILANIGVLNVDRRLRETLESSVRPSRSRTFLAVR